ncbi:hypothetical protein F5Y16DRAFT_57493 [Xylariaceae sp. FL0255]|nr:hypothetical protein F5Y16DRAFT_57493 [Xylariaceae sp. FL0255]
MHYATLITLALAALAAAVPSLVIIDNSMSDPNCTALWDYCSSCDPDDFDCESNPDCEWCFENDPSWQSNGTSVGGGGS